MENNIAGMFSALMDAGYPDAKVMFALFVVFIIFAYKALNVLKNAIIISVVSASFPFILDRVFGYDVEITVNLILFYAISGVVLYILYEIFRMLYKTSKLFLGIFNVLLYPFVLMSKMLYWLFGFGKGKKEDVKKHRQHPLHDDHDDDKVDTKKKRDHHKKD